MRHLFAFLVALMVTNTAFTQEVQWRTDYGQALAESKEKGLPLFIDAYMVPCGPCRMMDDTTFKDEINVLILNHKFIPVKIRQSRQTNRLLSELGVTSYPTQIFSAPSGLWIRSDVGYVDPAGFTLRLREVMWKVK